MAVERKISLEKNVLAGLITALIFSLGLTLGMVVDNMRVDATLQASKEQEINYQSLQLQYAFLTSLPNATDSCPTLKVALDKSMAELGESLDRFEDYKKDTRINEKEYSLIGRKYLLDNINYWFFSKKAKDLCDINMVSVLYFYSLKDCTVCPDQGVLLTYFKKIFDERLLVFPINVDMEKDEPFIKIMRSRYNITHYPSIVVQEKKYEGVVQKAGLSKLICEAFKTAPLECERFKNDQGGS